MFDLSKYNNYELTVYNNNINTKITVDWLCINQHDPFISYIEPVRLENKVGNYTGELNYLVVLVLSNNYIITIKCPTEDEALKIAKELCVHDY